MEDYSSKESVSQLKKKKKEEESISQKSRGVEKNISLALA